MLRTFLLIALCVMMASCGRALSTEERAFMAGLQGDSFDPAPVRIRRNPLIGLNSVTYAVRPRTTCRERIVPPADGPTVTGRIAGVVLFQTMHARPDFFLDDYIARDDGALNLVAAMFFAHEMTHIWQWQNRVVTDYHPARAFAEHLRTDDPYLFDGDSGFDFLEYGYEQQASLVEEYVCCRALDPRGARTERLKNLLSPYMSISPEFGLLDEVDILLPWDGAEIQGICS
ncbi:MAG: hypothetical protein AAGF88_12765 [Pseudomonadota bacterium]